MSEIDMKNLIPLVVAVPVLALALLGQARTQVSATAPACSGTNALLMVWAGTNSDCCTMTNVTFACGGGTNLFLARN